jgi:hypothetical protein
VLEQQSAPIDVTQTIQKRRNPDQEESPAKAEKNYLNAPTV